MTEETRSIQPGESPEAGKGQASPEGGAKKYQSAPGGARGRDDGPEQTGSGRTMHEIRK